MDRLTILAITGINSDLYSYSTEVGTGSNMHDVDGDFSSVCLTSSTDTGVTCDSLGRTKSLISYLSTPSDVRKLSLIFLYFSYRKLPKVLC